MSTCSSLLSARHEVNIFSRSLPRSIGQTSRAASQALVQKNIFLYSKERGSCKQQMQDILRLPRKNPIWAAWQAVRGTACRGEASILSRIETLVVGYMRRRYSKVAGKQAF